MPDGIQWLPAEEILTLEEITEVCRQAAGLGIRRIKVTGGEPLVREGCTHLVAMLKALPGIEQVTLTTNGVYLPSYAEALYRAGVDAVNVSLDTLDAKEYEIITGFDLLADVLEGIFDLEQRRIPVKMNVVPQQKKKDMWIKLAGLARNRRLDVRFIEMMPIGHGRGLRAVPNAEILGVLEECYGKMETDRSVHGNGPAVYYKVPGFLGSIGFISAVHERFCSKCNRIRLTSAGWLKPCLCFQEGVSVKEALRGGRKDEVGALIREAVRQKPKGHSFGDPQKITETSEMAKIGG